MTKKEIIAKLRKIGYKANYKNTLVTMLETKNYVIVIQKGTINTVPRNALEGKNDSRTNNQKN